MANKQFTKHAQRELNHNPNVVKCTPSKITFTEEFANKVCDALKKGEDPYKVFTDNGFSIRILGKPRIMGAIGLWRSRYGLEDLPRRKPEPKPKKQVETAKERRERNLKEAIAAVDAYIADLTSMALPANVDNDTAHFAAIKKVYDSKKNVIVKDVCAHYGYQYPKYYAYLQSLKPQQEEFVNILNPHRKNK
ncbi:MAG: HTH domain-containing protein [Bacilli bacterium]|jgi:hypothetical protein